MARKVLIITYYWPPSGGAGVQRWLKFVKYLRKNYGFELVIYTPENPEYPAIDKTLLKEIPEDITILKTPIWEPYQVYKKLAGISKEQKVNASGFISETKKPGKLQKLSVWLRGNFFIPDARKFWIRPSVNFLSEWLRDNTVDAIVSTGPPHSMHMIALALKKLTGIPWLADFRDPWTNIDFYHELQLTVWADRKHHKQEMEVLKNADDVVVISNSMKSDFEKICHRPYTVITNGFDEADMLSAKIIKDGPFSISHIGSMAKTRNPENLWKAMAKLKENVPSLAEDLVIKLAGTVDFEVTESIDRYGLTDNFQKISYKPHDEIITLQRQSRVLLLVINDTPNAKVILPGKFFEYMASGRPILCIGPHDGDAAAIIRETHSGYVAAWDNYDEIYETLSRLYRSYRENQDDLLAENIRKYSRLNLAGQMAERLESIIAR